MRASASAISSVARHAAGPSLTTRISSQSPRRRRALNTAPSPSRRSPGTAAVAASAAPVERTTANGCR